MPGRERSVSMIPASTGLRWGELAALTAAQVSLEARAVAVDRKVIEIRGQLYVEAPKNRKWRQAVYPSRTPRGWPLTASACCWLPVGSARSGRAGCSRRSRSRPLPPRRDG